MTSNVVATLSQADRMLAEVQSVPDAVRVADMAAVAKEYAKRAGLSRDIQNKAAEIHLRAQRKAGEFTRALDRGHGPGRGNKNMCNVAHVLSPYAEALEEAGATRKDAQRWQQLAEIPQESFDKTLAKIRETGEITTNAVLTKVHNHRAQGTGENEWYTPRKYVDLARQVMGHIQLDPASSEVANKVVGADKFFTAEDDGLKREWFGNVWLNPPYSQPLIAHFVEKLLREVESGRVEQAIVLTHNYTDTAWWQNAATHAGAVCFTRGRIRFESPSGDTASPTQGQTFLYYGSEASVFADLFAPVGLVLR